MTLSRILLCAGLVFGASHSSALGAGSQATVVYQDAIGWHAGQCAVAGFNDGLTKNCDVMPQTGPGSEPPNAKNEGFAPVFLRCRDRGAERSPMSWESVVGGHLLNRLTIWFESGVPTKIVWQMSTDLTREKYFIAEVYDLTSPKDAVELSDTRKLMAMISDVDQFICGGTKEKQERYQRLLAYNQSRLSRP